MAKDEDFSFEINKHIGILSEGSKGWNLEVNIVTFGDGEPKVDIRKWNEDHTKMSKGISLSKSEYEELVSICIDNPSPFVKKTKKKHKGKED